VKLPPPSVIAPLSCVELLLVNALFATLQVDAVQPGPLKITMAPLGSKLAPVIVKVNGCPPTSVVGVVLIALS